ncbi:MAG: ATP-binding cassette domain-containing protein [Candidatus Cloacimonetes bacterium]|nr:ATP-binding cassette domain-containing protein [Candidatus Cloacimonadota bacterium]
MSLALGMVGLKGFEKRKSKQLSGGEVQRIALARAMILNPEVLLLDEPTANVDKESIIRISDVLKKIKGKTTIIISSHDEKFAYHNSDEIIRLENGKIKNCSENIFKGITIEQSEDSLLFKVNDVLLKCPAAKGDFNTIVIDFNDVILSGKEIETSARNKFKGKVVRIRKTENLFTVTMDIGFEISSLITAKSLNEFAIRVGEEMFLAFKSSAVRLY